MPARHEAAPLPARGSKDPCHSPLHRQFLESCRRQERFFKLVLDTKAAGTRKPSGAARRHL